MRIIGGYRTWLVLWLISIPWSLGIYLACGNDTPGTQARLTAADKAARSESAGQGLHDGLSPLAKSRRQCGYGLDCQTEMGHGITRYGEDDGHQGSGAEGHTHQPRGGRSTSAIVDKPTGEPLAEPRPRDWLRRGSVGHRSLLLGSRLFPMKYWSLIDRRP